MRSKPPSLTPLGSPDNYQRTTLNRSFRNAFRGIAVAATERNLRVHLLFAFLVIILGHWFQLNRSEWGLLIIAIALVVVTELVNSAIETVVNLSSPGYAKLARDAKDVAAGAVLTAALLSLVIGYLVFLPYIGHWPEQLFVGLRRLPSQIMWPVGFFGLCGLLWLGIAERVGLRSWLFALMVGGLTYLLRLDPTLSRLLVTSFIGFLIWVRLGAGFSNRLYLSLSLFWAGLAWLLA